MPYEEVERLVRQEKLEEKYDVGAELGRGKFAIVKRVTEKASGQQFAAKFLRKRRGGKACRDDIIVEVDIMRQSMNHHRIIKLREVFESTREMIIIIELATGGELFRMIAVDPLPEDKARSVVLQLLEGVEHLHSLNIVHLDLKPENILLYRKGQLDIRIADFGLALQISPGEQVKTLVGTAEYVAPEILNYEPLSVSADMWSIGALTYALLTGYSPFQGETHSDTFYNVSMCEYDFEDEVFDDVSQEAKDFIEELLQKKPSDRLTASKCLSHPWMKNNFPTVVPSSIVSSSPSSSAPQNTQCLHSSTSSLDSALCLDSTNSSLDPSPSSSASSSFAPRPSGRSGEDDEQEDMKKQLTEKVSKLCTEMQRVETINGSLRGNLIGSASSISSSDSNITVKVDEEDGGGAVDEQKKVEDVTGTSSEPEPSLTPPPSSQSTTPTPHGSSHSFDLSGHFRRVPVGSEDEGGKRPNSRLTTPIDDLLSLAPETIEKMKKLERLKRKKDEAVAAQVGGGEGTVTSSPRPPLTKKLSHEPAIAISPRGSERRVSSPASIRNLKGNPKKLEAAVEEEEASAEDKQNPCSSSEAKPTTVNNAKLNSESNKEGNNDKSVAMEAAPVAVDSNATKIGDDDTASSTSDAKTSDKPVVAAITVKSSPPCNEIASSKLSTPIENKTAPVSSGKEIKPQSSAEEDAGKAKCSFIGSSKGKEGKKASVLTVKSSIEKKVMFFSKGTESQPVAPTGSNGRKSPSLKREDMIVTTPLSTQNKSEDISLPKAKQEELAMQTEKENKNQQQQQLKVAPRSKSETPSSPVVSSKDFTPPPTRSVKSSSPVSTTVSDVKRRARKNHDPSRKSWRNTPHIDPDVIDAILRGDFEMDEGDGSSSDPKLETMTEEVEPRTESPLAGRTGMVVLGSTPVHLTESSTSAPILKKSGFSDPRLERVTKSESPRRVVMMVSSMRSESSLETSSSSPDHTPPLMRSPLKSPGCLSQTDATTSSRPEKTHLSALQSSLSLSRSTPDLSSILGSGKHSKRSQGMKEDFYVTGGGTPSASTRKGSVSRGTGIRTSLLGGTHIVRSLTMAANRGKRSSKEKLK